MKKSIIILSILSIFIISCGSKPKTEDKTQEQIENEISSEVENVVEETKEETLVDNSQLLAELNSIREDAINSGCEKLCPDQFNAAETLYKTLEPQAKEGLNIQDSLNDLKARYEAMKKYSECLALKDKIEKNELKSFDEANYNKANEIVEDFTNPLKLSNVSGNAMLEKIDTAYKAYKSVIFKAYKSKARDARENAYKAKRNADSVKAGVAAKAEYLKAAEEFKAGDSNFAIQNPESALKNYENAEVQFTQVYEFVKIKREAAQKAMDEAKSKVEQSNNYAVEADTEAPLTGEEIQGIEKSDTVLLEEEKFEDPKNSEVVIPEDISIEENVEESVESENKILQLEKEIEDNSESVKSELENTADEVQKTLETVSENVTDDSQEAK